MGQVERPRCGRPAARARGAPRSRQTTDRPENRRRKGRAQEHPIGRTGKRACPDGGESQLPHGAEVGVSVREAPPRALEEELVSNSGPPHLGYVLAVEPVAGVVVLLRVERLPLGTGSGS